MKRFTDTDIWKKEWFQDLPPKYKMAWFYLKDNCDSVGVWNVNFRLANFQVGTKIDWEEFRELCNGNIIAVSDKKWWLVDFCSYQYGDLSESSKSPPVVSYIKQLKKHSLWEGYTKGIYTIKEKDKEKDKVKDKEKVKEKEPILHKHGEYHHVLLTDKEYEGLKDKVSNREDMIKRLDEYIETSGKRYKNHSLVLQNWDRKDKKDKPKSGKIRTEYKEVIF
jgi:hypothetical protein